MDLKHQENFKFIMNTILLKESIEELQFDEIFYGQKYHEILNLTICFKSLEQYLHLSRQLALLDNLIGLHINIKHKTINPQISLLELFQAIKTLINLKQFSFYMDSSMNQNQLQDLTAQLGSCLKQLVKLEVLNLNFQNGSQLGLEGSKMIGESINELKNLKSLKFHLSLNKADDISDQILKNLQKGIYSLSNIQTLDFQISYNLSYVEVSFINNFEFNQMTNLKELNIVLSLNTTILGKIEVINLNESLIECKCLAKLEIIINGINFKVPINQLLNSIFQLRNLEEFSIQLSVNKFNNDTIIIGEELNSEQKLRIFKINLQNLGKQSCNLQFGKGIVNLQNLEQLSITCGQYDLLYDSLSVLQKWTLNWGCLQDLFFSFSQINCNSEKIVSILGESFQHLKILKNLSFQISPLQKRIYNNYTFLDYLSNLPVLETLMIENIYEFSNNNQQKYLNCFKGFSNLKNLHVNIYHANEFIFVGQQLQHVTQIITLDLYISQEVGYQNFHTLCENLHLLKNLEVLLIYFSEDIRMNVSLDEIGLSGLLQQLTHLKNLKQMQLSIYLSEEALRLFITKIPDTFSQLTKINYLTLYLPFNPIINITLFQKIQKYLKKLVVFSHV